MDSPKGKAMRHRREKWARTTGRGLHRAAERTALAIAAQFDTKSVPGAFLAPPEKGRIEGTVLNVRPDPVDFRDAIYQASLVELATRMIPEPLAQLGLEVRAQGREGSCTGQALAAVIDMQNIRRHAEGADVPKRVSARMLYESARAFDEYAYDDLPGSSARGAIKGFFHRGVCSDAIAPYFEGDLGWRLTVQRAKDARRVTLGTYFRLHHVLNDYHAAITEARAILCTAMIHRGWSAEAVAGARGRITLPAKREAVELIGAHAFAIVGYDPDGFLVLNSWGEHWGGYIPSEVPGRGAPLLGMAHWSYDDWCDHVLDAWVLRLQVPANRPSGFVGGFHLVRRPTALRVDPLRSPSSGASLPARNILGHFVNVADGAFVAVPPYDNDRRTFEETARFLRANENADDENRYDHLLLYAHGGLNDVDAAAARAAAMTPVFKQHGVYPVFFFWHTGLGETAADLLTRLFERAAQRAGGFFDLTDRLLEQIVRPFARPLWREMKADAARSFVSGAARGDGWTATQILLDAARARTRRRLQLHLAGHSAGAIFLGQMLARARGERYPLTRLLATISLFAPACTTDFFRRQLAPAAAALGAGAFAVYNLPDPAEQEDGVAALYRKSLLYLVSNAFEDESPTPLAGMDIFWREMPPLLEIAYHLAGVTGPGILQPASRAAAHGAFDNDPVTMNHVLGRIIGRPGISDVEGGFSLADLTGRGF
jgi:hypothetical protein